MVLRAPEASLSSRGKASGWVPPAGRQGRASRAGPPTFAFGTARSASASDQISICTDGKLLLDKAAALSENNSS